MHGRAPKVKLPCKVDPDLLTLFREQCRKRGVRVSPEAEKALARYVAWTAKLLSRNGGKS